MLIFENKRDQRKVQHQKKQKKIKVWEEALKWVMVLFLALVQLQCKVEPEPKITIATAANMQFAMEELITAFTDKTGIPCTMVVSSSGKLTAQIIAGAPYDIFAAADMKYPQEIYEKGLAQRPPKIYAYGTLVLWSLLDEVTPSLPILEENIINHIAIANPKTAPYGKAAKMILEEKGIYNTLEEKLVFGESIAQTNQFILSKAVEIGFTARSVVAAPKMKGKGQWIALDGINAPKIDQGVVLITRNNSNTNGAQQFYNFLSSPEAQAILKTYGYLKVSE